MVSKTTEVLYRATGIVISDCVAKWPIGCVAKLWIGSDSRQQNPDCNKKDREEFIRSSKELNLGSKIASKKHIGLQRHIDTCFGGCSALPDASRPISPSP
jgi:hypothetical protein